MDALITVSGFDDESAAWDAVTGKIDHLVRVTVKRLRFCLPPDHNSAEYHTQLQGPVFATSSLTVYLRPWTLWTKPLQLLPSQSVTWKKLKSVGWTLTIHLRDLSQQMRVTAVAKTSPGRPNWWHFSPGWTFATT